MLVKNHLSTTKIKAKNQKSVFLQVCNIYKKNPESIFGLYFCSRKLIFYQHMRNIPPYLLNVENMGIWPQKIFSGHFFFLAYEDNFLYLPGKIYIYIYFFKIIYKSNMWPFPIQKIIYYDILLCFSTLKNFFRKPFFLAGKGLFKNP